MATGNWQALVADKRQRQEASIPKQWRITVPPESQLDVTRIPEECGLLSVRDIQITNSDVPTLLSKLAEAEWSSLEVTLAFYKRAVVAHQLVNCLTEIFVERALARAKDLDERLHSTGKVAGPLHGLPVSCKDMLRIKGLETTIGYASYVGTFADKNSVLVDILLECGANPFVKTNVPQTLMWPETHNLLFGRTLNPYNRSLTCGGSSGGEGALVALRGSPVGMGSDVGGSIRIPSDFNGLYGLKPSYGRTPHGGAVTSMDGQDSVVATFGPMAATASGVHILMQAILSAKPWLKDPLAVRKEWNERAYKLEEHGGGSGLCFGFCWSNGQTVPHPPVVRAMEMTKRALIAAGHTVVDWTPYRHIDLYNTLNAIWSVGPSDFATITSSSGEPILPSMNPGPESRPPPASSPLSAYALWQQQKLKREIREEYAERWEASVGRTGTGRPVDAVISPVAPWAAAPHGMNRDSSYTAVWNALDYPSCAFPVTRVDPALDPKRPAHEFLSVRDQKNWRLYDPNTYANAPVGLQLSGRTLEEEAVIAMTEIVASALKAHKDALDKTIYPDPRTKL